MTGTFYGFLDRFGSPGLIGVRQIHDYRFFVTKLDYLPHAYQAWAFEAIKKAVKVPVICSGSLNYPELAEAIFGRQG